MAWSRWGSLAGLWSKAGERGPGDLASAHPRPARNADELPDRTSGGFREIASYSEVSRPRGAAMTIAVEEKRVRSLFERVEAVEEVAETLADDDERRAKLLAVSNAALAEEGTIRPVIAARR